MTAPVPLTKSAQRALMAQARLKVHEARLRTKLGGIYRAQLKRADDNKPPLPVDYTREEFIGWILPQLKRICVYCNKTLTPSSFHCDHKLPVSRGGRFDLENTHAICSSCNLQKGLMTHWEFIEFLAMLRSGFVAEVQRDVLRRLSTGGKFCR